jgi:polyhydroxyalkanoate synthesis regulator phasin
MSRENLGAGAGPLKSLWLAGLGLAVIVGEETGKGFRHLVEKGREVEPKLKGACGEMAGKARGCVHRAVDETVAGSLERLGHSVKQEIEACARKLEELEKRLESLRGQQAGAV